MPPRASGIFFAFTYPGCIRTCSCPLSSRTRSLCSTQNPSSCLCCLFLMPCALQSSGKADSERAAHAMADPEIQMILTDPMVRQVLTDFKENPQHAQKVPPALDAQEIVIFHGLTCALRTSPDLFSCAWTVIVAVIHQSAWKRFCAHTAIDDDNSAHAVTRFCFHGEGWVSSGLNLNFRPR